MTDGQDDLFAAKARRKCRKCGAYMRETARAYWCLVCNARIVKPPKKEKDERPKG